jgi:hypothetical protein
MIYDRTDREVTNLVPLFKVRRILQVSWPTMMGLVRTRAFPVVNISDEPMSLEDVGEDGSGLRVKSEDLQNYIDSRRL